MVNQFYSNPRTLQRIHEGPLGAYMDMFATYLHENGFARSSGRYRITVIAKLSRWLEQRKLGIGDLNEKRVNEFILGRKRSGRLRHGDAATLYRLLEQLRRIGAIGAPAPATVTEGPLDRIEHAFKQYLEEDRGLVEKTVERYLPFIHQFLLERFGQKPAKLSRLCANDVTGFVLRHARDNGPRSAKFMVTALRSFLRFLRMHGEISTDLAGCVPAVAEWRLATLPKSLEPEQVERILAACDRRTLCGKRDYAILLLLARLGLRAGEVVALTLEDIDWEAGELTIRGKGSRQNRLPLPSDVGRALVTYLKKGRPRRPSRRLFIRSCAPLTGFANQLAVGAIVRRAFFRAGICTPHKGAHVLRHSLANRMLKSGASLREIGAILRHQNPDTTAIYAKVDLASLREIARPWPGSQS